MLFDIDTMIQALDYKPIWRHTCKMLSSACITPVAQELARKPYEVLDFCSPEGTVCFLTGSSTSYSLRGVGAKGGQYWYSFVSALSSNSMPASASSSLRAASFFWTTSALGVGYPLKYQQAACEPTWNLLPLKVANVCFWDWPCQKTRDRRCSICAKSKLPKSASLPCES